MKYWAGARRVLAIALCAVIFLEDTNVSKAYAKEQSNEYFETLEAASDTVLDDSNEGADFVAENNDAIWDGDLSAKTESGSGGSSEETNEEGFSVIDEINEVISNVTGVVTEMIEDVKENGIIQIEKEDAGDNDGTDTGDDEDQGTEDTENPKTDNEGDTGTGDVGDTEDTGTGDIGNTEDSGTEDTGTDVRTDTPNDSGNASDGADTGDITTENEGEGEFAETEYDGETGTYGDVSTNDISINDISTNDLKIKDVSAGDISLNELKKSSVMKAGIMALAKAPTDGYVSDYIDYDLSVWYPSWYSWKETSVASENRYFYLQINIYVNDKLLNTTFSGNNTLLAYPKSESGDNGGSLTISSNGDYEFQSVVSSKIVNGKKIQNSDTAYRDNNTFTFYSLSLSQYSGSTINCIDVYLKSAKKIDTVSTADILNLSLYNYKITDNSINKDSRGRERTFRFFGTGESQQASEYYNVWTEDELDSALIVGGIVQNRLKDGYPVLNVGNGESLDYLFKASTNGVLSVVPNADFLFTYDENTGYYSYDSKTEYAVLKNGTFEGNVTDGSSHAGSYYNTDYMGRFSPFGEGSGGDPINDYKDSFGMILEISSFIQPKNGKVNGDDMIFKFGGDDDVWIFIDDVLVLDLGGIHNLANGTINYATGQVTGANVKNTDSYGKTTSSTTLYEAFKNAGKNVDDIFVKGADGAYRFRDYSTHSLKMFYFERGGDKSNCQITFNMPIIPKETVSITKNIDGEEREKVDPNATYSFRLYADDNLVAENTPFSIYENGVETGTGYVGRNGTFILKMGQTAVFEVIEDTDVYVLAETATFADRVVADGVEIPETEADDGVKEHRFEINGSGSVTFTNFYDTPITDLVPVREVKKTVDVKDEASRVYSITLSANAYDTARKLKYKNGELVVESEEIVGFKTGDITDYITSEFVLTNEARSVIASNGGTYSVSEDGLYTVVSFEDAVLDNWSVTFDIQAKPDFIGGNLIYTNVNEKSQVVIEGNPYDFEDPTVNVVTNSFSLKNDYVVLFLGEEITPESYVNLIDEGLTPEIISALIENGSYSEHYAYSSYNGVTGELSYTLCEAGGAKLTQHKADTIGEPLETYILTKTFTPLSVDLREMMVSPDRLSPVGNTAKEQAAEGSYRVYVIDGTLTIIKHINSLEYMKTEGDPIFTFRIEGKNTGNVYYKTVRFSLDKLPSYIKLIAGEAYISVTITGLEKDEYVITELDTLGFVLEGLEATESNKCRVDIYDGSIHAFIGYDTVCVFDINNELQCLYGDYAETMFSNRRRRSSDPRSPLTDTDTRKNRFVFGEVILQDENGDSGTTWNATTHENE